MDVHVLLFAAITNFINVTVVFHSFVLKTHFTSVFLKNSENAVRLYNDSTIGNMLV